MKRLEYKIETEALSFDKEKKLMKHIHSLKKLYEENSELKKLNAEYVKLIFLLMEI